jgi:hypothetical protein
MGSARLLTPEELVNHWLLNCAVDYRPWLHHIIPVVADESLNVKAIPNCAAEDYAEGIRALCEAGRIQLFSENAEGESEIRSDVSEVLDMFLRLPREDQGVRVRRVEGRLVPSKLRVHRPELQITFGLTATGGEAWERIAEPHWANFFTQFSDFKSGELSSQNLALLMARLGWLQELNGEQIKPDSIKLEKHAEYQILYWKRLPKVYRAEFSISPGEPRWDRGRNGEPKWFRNWWWSMARWHREPWDLPGWPSEG